ncbi:MAG: Crp/Fnr family transcriptional regulator [Dehalogenimonas sp.]|uniref:Crp/Fnr family transcriptional regulator n=1 Tax=Candidatus Dehalogenimonas loeffleri TaxID=3127115 RepID=A0ABZ2J324_9CHLR|nr:Crp/Fnr family transcriptional regulator [Dehalogenimonas sp.]
MDIPSAVASLRRAYLFSSSKETDLTEIVSKSEVKKYEAGEYLFWEGDPPEFFYLLTEGRVKVMKHGSLGRETVVAFFSPGDIFGEVAVLENKPYPASCQAVAGTEVLTISRKTFNNFIERNPAVAMAMVAILSARLREAQSRLHDMAGERVEQRLARTLERLFSKIGSELPFTRQDLADMSGTTLETTVRFLSRLKEGGIISSRRGLVIIKDDVKLRLLAEGPPDIA